MREINTISDQLMYKHEFDPKDSVFVLTPDGTNKPQTALWTSTLLEDGTSAWYEYCQDNSFPFCNGDVNKYILYPKKDLKILEIDNEDDLEDMPIIDCSDALDCDYLKSLNIHLIDFRKLHKMGYDGLHLTERGAAFGHWMLTHEPWFSMRFHLDSWSCESTVWFNVDWIDKYERVV